MNRIYYRCKLAGLNKTQHDLYDRTSAFLDKVDHCGPNRKVLPADKRTYQQWKDIRSPETISLQFYAMRDYYRTPFRRCVKGLLHRVDKICFIEKHNNCCISDIIDSVQIQHPLCSLVHLEYSPINFQGPGVFKADSA